MIVAGLFNFSLAQAFDYPAKAFVFDGALISSLGAASVLAMYSYGGYNQVCNIGDEITDPTRTVPRSIFLSIAHRRRALHADDDRHPRHDSVGAGPRLAHRGLDLHRADVRRSGHRAASPAR